MPPKLVFGCTPTCGPSWVCSALSPRTAPPGPGLRGGTGFGGGTTFRSCAPCADRASGRSDRFPDTAELAACETLGALETIWATANAGEANSSARLLKTLMLNVLLMTVSTRGARLLTAARAYLRATEVYVNELWSQFAVMALVILINADYRSASLCIIMVLLLSFRNGVAASRPAQCSTAPANPRL